NSHHHTVTFDAMAHRSEILKIPADERRAGPEFDVRVPARREPDAKMRFGEIVVREDLVKASRPKKSHHRNQLAVHLESVELIFATFDRNGRCFEADSKPMPECRAESEIVGW